MRVPGRKVWLTVEQARAMLELAKSRRLMSKSPELSNYLIVRGWRMVHEKQVIGSTGTTWFSSWLKRDSSTEKVADRQRKVGVAGQKRVL